MLLESDHIKSGFISVSTTETTDNIVLETSLESKSNEDGELLHQSRTLPTFSLENRVCVVTGGARGIGLAIGEALLTSGADLAIIDIDFEEAKRKADELCTIFKDCSKRPSKITAHSTDVSQPASVQSVIAEIVKEHGKIDSLVTCAGFTENFEAVNYPYDRLTKLWGVNVDGTYLCAVEVAKHLMERNSPGSMVLIGSMSGNIVNVPQPQTPYNVSKAAVRHMAASLAVEWASSGIRVNCLSPGYVLTALTQRILTENATLSQQWVSMTPQKRLGKPEDLAGPVTFLLSDAAKYVTGADLRVDGGYTLI